MTLVSSAGRNEMKIPAAAAIDRLTVGWRVAVAAFNLIIIRRDVAVMEGPGLINGHQAASCWPPGGWGHNQVAILAIGGHRLAPKWLEVAIHL